MRGGIEVRRLALGVALAALVASGRAEGLEVGFGRADITPDLDGGQPVWIAGYGHNRRATGVHDPLFARAVVLKDGAKKVALVSVDLVGFMYPSTQGVRRRLDGFAYVLIACTHSHEGPDTIGLWGPSRLESGVDPAYMARAERGIVEAVRRADAASAEVEAAYGTAEDESLIRDTRLPTVKDGVIRVVRFSRRGHGRPAGLIVQWSCHPESLGSKNTRITADFPAATIAALEERHGCPVAYFSGAVGGLMTTPREIETKEGTRLAEGAFEFARAYGEKVADLADAALVGAGPLRLTPFRVSARPIAVPMTNPVYRLGRQLGVLSREAFAWTGDADRLGPAVAGRFAPGALALETEVAYLRLGELHLAAIPGELYPELVYGTFQEPAEPLADAPEAPREPAVMGVLPGPKALLFGLANDELGYIIPKRQWDEAAPFAYGRAGPQYGEVNSVGPETAPILMKALRDRVREADAREAAGGRP